MPGEPEEDVLDGAGAGFLFLVFGLPVQVFFNAITQGLDAHVFLLAFAGFTTLILFGEVNLTFPSGAALGVGVLLTSFAAQDWWLVWLAVAAVAINLSKQAWTDSKIVGSEDLESSIIQADSNL